MEKKFTYLNGKTREILFEYKGEDHVTTVRANFEKETGLDWINSNWIHLVIEKVT